MKNKGSIVRSGSSPLGGHKLDSDTSMEGRPTILNAAPSNPPSVSLHDPVRIPPDPEGSRYTLVLKIHRSAAEAVVRLCGSADLSTQAGARRALTMKFRSHVICSAIVPAPKRRDTDLVTLRLDIRLPEEFVRLVLSAEKAAPLEPRSTTLARNFAPVFESFVLSSY